MSKNHWQIVKHEADGRFEEGTFKTYAVEQAPREVVELALRAAGLIGDGLYGVDLKQTDRGPVVIEINDNPNLEVGIEDAVLKDELYRRVLGDLVRRIELRRGQAPRGPPDQHAGSAAGARSVEMIGVLGGMGPAATLDFLAKLVRLTHGRARPGSCSGGRAVGPSYLGSRGADRGRPRPRRSGGLPRCPEALARPASGGTRSTVGRPAVIRPA